MRKVTIGLLGCGTVGGGFLRLLELERARIRTRFAIELEVKRILVRDPERNRGVDRSLLTTSAVEVIDSGCDVVVELIGGTHSAGAYVRRAIDRGLHVVTANKALLSSTGRQLFAAAAGRGVRIGFEASVCGGVPVVRALQRGLAGDSVESITGILNGTSNFILTRMDGGATYDEALQLAQEHGLAEADPSLDVDGTDAAQKLAILADLAFDQPLRKVSVSGIRGVDIRGARHGGSVVRLVAEAKRVAGGVNLTVGPRLLARGHPLAGIVDENNAVLIRGRAVGELLLTGKGAGSMPTAAAVLSDVIEVAA